ncbi:unnamed protein product [Paramecium pentaurelia]|uniref:Uncharacterized protein n=1 Tax=Paramecium pentaurelia TaxID=43138 RepID=A0A8S1S249_9CILI|nr:unnamed protein product [Paramecium pentaurelia]
MEFQEILDGYQLICNELQGSQNYKNVMELYNRSANLQDLFENGLIIEGIQYDFDLSGHIDATKLALDRFVQNVLDSDAVVQGHRKITSAFASLKKQLVQKDEQQKVVIMTNSQVIASNPISQQKHNKAKLFDTQLSSENLDDELQEEIFNITKRMKGMAVDISEQLKFDNKVIDKILHKQDGNKSKLKFEENKLINFMKSKSLSCSSLFLMLTTSIFLFIFAIIFIRIS